MNHVYFYLNSNAVAKPKRSNKKREVQALCMLGLLGLALFMLSGCVTSSSGNPTPTSTLDESNGGGGY